LFVLAQIAGYGWLTVVSFPFGKNVVKLKTAMTGGGEPVALYGNH